ncbi:MAG: glutaredoxin family protein [Chloroflexi bacterium]|nr:glutaredoxin family protein [Chloroflexota bacterium]
MFKQDLETAVSTNPRFAFTLTELDITQDHDLFAKYRYSIPVVEIGATTLRAPITVSEIIGVLKTAVS